MALLNGGLHVTQGLGVWGLSGLPPLTLFIVGVCYPGDGAFGRLRISFGPIAFSGASGWWGPSRWLMVLSHMFPYWGLVFVIPMAVLLHVVYGVFLRSF